MRARLMKLMRKKPTLCAVPKTQAGGTSGAETVFYHGAKALPRECLALCSSQREVCRAFATVTAGFHVERHFLRVRKAGQARAFDGGDVDENVLTARIRLDEAEAFLGIEKLHGAVGHARGLLFIRCPQDAAARQSQTERSTEAG